MSGDANAVATTGKTDISAAQKKTQTNMRTLRGHTGAITALHCVTRKEVWDLVGDREDAGFFISGSTDCTVSLKLILLILILVRLLLAILALASQFTLLSAMPACSRAIIHKLITITVLQLYQH